MQQDQTTSVSPNSTNVVLAAVRFNKEDLDFFLPKSFKGLSKEYILEAVFNEQIQKNWRPQIGDVIVGRTGNVFVISGYHQTHESLGGDKFFFGGSLCSRDGGNFLNDTHCYVLNKDGMEYYYGHSGIEKQENPYYSKFSDFRYVPYPHER